MNSAIDETRRKMEKTIKNLKEELAHIRTSRASVALLEGIKVDCYGTKLPIPQVATVNVVEGKMLVIQPWDPSLLKEIEKAIQKSDLGINPTSDGKVIRLVIPPLTEERRRELVKKAGKLAEQAKIAVRNVRHEVMKELDKLKKEGGYSEDDIKRAKDELQKITDKHTKKIDELLHKKEEEILTV